MGRMYVITANLGESEPQPLFLCAREATLNRIAIQYEVSVCASHLPKHSHLVSATVDETFLLLTALVGA